MAHLHHHNQIQFPVRPLVHKETEWQSFCNNVFDEYLKDDDLFGLGNGQYCERSNADESINLLDISGSSGQSDQTAGTSPIPIWNHAAAHAPRIEAKQPKPEASVDFWQKTLKALEQNAAESEQKQRTLRATKSHPDFLSLGGHPSPPALPLPIDQSMSVQRRRVPRQAANGNRVASSATRSVSRGRPTGIAKAGPTAPNVSPRKPSSSPHKMMTPSRFRVGFKDVWADKTLGSPKMYAVHVPSDGLPASPPSSAKLLQQDFAAFGSSAPFDPQSAYDAQISPLTTNFQQQARIHTPGATPSHRAQAQADHACFEGVPAIPLNPYAPQTISLNDAAMFSERITSLAPSRIGSFDFGFDTTSPDIPNWNDTAFEQNISHCPSDDPFTSTDPFANLQHTIIPTIEQHDPLVPGLGISCDPNLITAYTSMAEIAPMTAPLYGHIVGQKYARHDLPARTAPNTSHTHHHRRTNSLSPSPPLQSPTSRRRSSKISSHRRAKSMTTAPQQLEKVGFVNFTPQDSNKILSGVAPSGSSKTKARREKEAADKRRRLSLAAVKAIVEAGGDLEGLRGVGLFG